MANKPLRVLAPRDLPAKGIHFHPNHLRRMWEKGKFPRPRKLTPRKIVWSEKEIDDWLTEKMRDA